MSFTWVKEENDDNSIKKTSVGGRRSLGMSHSFCGWKQSSQEEFYEGRLVFAIPLSS